MRLKSSDIGKKAKDDEARAKLFQTVLDALTKLENRLTKIEEQLAKPPAAPPPKPSFDFKVGDVVRDARGLFKSATIHAIKKAMN